MVDKVPRIVYQFWTGDNPLSDNRQKCLESSKNIGIKTSFLTPNEIYLYEHSSFPYHPAFKCLSKIHQADYLRCYFMHMYGGGYADIKCFTERNNWAECFNVINGNDDLEFVGEKEIIGGTPLGNLNNGRDIQKLCKVCFFIVRPHSEFTNRWINEIHRILDDKYKILKEHPARDNDVFGRADDYPIYWAEICGSILHKIMFDYSFMKPKAISNMLVGGHKMDFCWR